LLGEYLEEHKIAFEYGRARLEDRRGIEADIRRVRPTHVLNAAGVTGRPNVDWCETHQIETIRANVIGCLNLADVTNAHGIHMTYYGTGCIFAYDDTHQMGPGNKGFTEEDEPNFTGSYYSHTKAMVENLLKVGI